MPIFQGYDVGDPSLNREVGVLNPFFECLGYGLSVFAHRKTERIPIIDAYVWSNIEDFRDRVVSEQG